MIFDTLKSKRRPVIYFSVYLQNFTMIQLSETIDKSYVLAYQQFDT